MALFGRDYDRDFNRGYRGSNWGGNRTNYSQTGGAPLNRETYGRGYTREMGYSGSNRYGSDFGPAGYDRGYDRGYKSQWQTDYGDPFNDRQQNTPMRMIREDQGGYDRGYNNDRYDREFNSSPYPMGYRSYTARNGYDAGFDRGPGNDSGFSNRGYRNYGRRDNTWF